MKTGTVWGEGEEEEEREREREQETERTVESTKELRCEWKYKEVCERDKRPYDEMMKVFYCN